MIIMYAKSTQLDDLNSFSLLPHPYITACFGPLTTNDVAYLCFDAIRFNLFLITPSMYMYITVCFGDA